MFKIPYLGNYRSVEPNGETAIEFTFQCRSDVLTAPKVKTVLHLHNLEFASRNMSLHSRPPLPLQDYPGFWRWRRSAYGTDNVKVLMVSDSSIGIVSKEYDVRGKSKIA
jgi:hypothetical protein